MFVFKGTTVSKIFGASKTFGKPGGTSLGNTSGGTQAKVVPIASLTPYQSKWVISWNKFRRDLEKNIRGYYGLFSYLYVNFRITTHKIGFLLFFFSRGGGDNKLWQPLTLNKRMAKRAIIHSLWNFIRFKIIWNLKDLMFQESVGSPMSKNKFSNSEGILSCHINRWLLV